MPSILKRSLTILLILFGSISLANAQTGATPQAASIPAPSTWTWVQDSPVIFCGQYGSISSCTIGAAQIAPTQPGSVWVIQVMTPNNVTITSITGGGGTWIKCPNCHAFNPSGFSIDAWYNLTGNAGTTQNITINLSGASGAFFNINFFELLPPPGTTASYDDSGSVIRTGCTTCTAVQLNNITATDIIIENPGGASQAAWNSWSAPYVTDTNGGAYSLNTRSGAAPTTTFDAVSNPSFMAIAFKSSAGIFTPPTPQYSVVNFKAVTQTCSPTCALSFPATGAGHLLYLEAADLNNDHIVSVNGGGNWVVPTGANTCQINYVQAGNNAFSCAYVLSSVAGATSINVTLNGNSSTGFGIWEIATTSGTFTLDTQGSHVNAASFAPPGQALTLNGANDVIFQMGFVPGGASAVSYYPQSYIDHNSTYILFNEASESLLLDSGPTAPVPVWINPQNNTTAVTGVAFMTVGGPTPPSPPTGLTATVH